MVKFVPFVWGSLPKGRRICMMEVDHRKQYQILEKHMTDEAKSKHRGSIKQLWNLRFSQASAAYTETSSM